MHDVLNCANNFAFKVHCLMYKNSPTYQKKCGTCVNPKLTDFLQEKNKVKRIKSSDRL